MRVKLSDWFPRGSELFQATMDMIGYLDCRGCKRAVQYDEAYGDHTIPWGKGSIWCQRCNIKHKA